jgi:hypothetical protein
MSSNEGIKQFQIFKLQEKAIMRHSKLSILWSIRRLQLKLPTSTCLKMVARDIHFWLTERENTVVTKTLNIDLTCTNY